MKQDIIEKLVRPMIREVTPYRSARDEFEDFDAQKIFLDANENPFDNGVNRYPDPLQRNLKRTLAKIKQVNDCLLYTSPSPRDKRQSRMPSSA